MPALLGICLSVLAGLSTGIGGLVVLCVGAVTPRICGRMLAFAAGVMVWVSLFDIVPEVFLHTGDALVLILWFTGGVFLFWSIEALMPEISAEFISQHLEPMSHTPSPHPPSPPPVLVLQQQQQQQQPALTTLERKDLLRTSLIVLTGLSLHNLPEGSAVFMSSMTEDPKFSIRLALAIAMHNIPEGICLAVPLFAATRSRWVAMKWSLLSGLCEPLGAIVFGLLIRSSTEGPDIIFATLAAVAGMMFAISIFELWPAARKYLPTVSEAATWLVLGGLTIWTSSLLIGD